uniref:Uncharacterized protein n=1 Tax=Physcomitrium patens TaxID=3218 RepID=A0A2K1IJ14_PHYPA|nr:hypothetical protein PHYPA_027956 [Physcomitrium patens]
MASREAITYGIVVAKEKKDIFDKHVEMENLWNHAITNMDKKKQQGKNCSR